VFDNLNPAYISMAQDQIADGFLFRMSIADGMGNPRPFETGVVAAQAVVDYDAHGEAPGLRADWLFVSRDNFVDHIDIIDECFPK
jgi:hypothetical protein